MFNVYIFTLAPDPISQWKYSWCHCKLHNTIFYNWMGNKYYNRGWSKYHWGGAQYYWGGIKPHREPPSTLYISSTIRLLQLTWTFIKSSFQFLSFCWLGILYAFIPADCDCGEANTSNRIVGGEETERHEYPWQVGLFVGANHLCGGTIISSRHVLTAAHCTEGLTADSVRICSLYAWESHKLKKYFMHPYLFPFLITFT